MAKTEVLNAFDEIPEKATDEERSRPLVDKIQLLDQEIRLLHEFCVKSGLNSKEIECCAKPFLQEQQDVNRKKWLSRVFYTSLIIALIAFVVWYDPTYRCICVIGKLSSMKLLPYWDWTKQFEIECLIDNPYYMDQDALTEDDCGICHELSGSRLSNISQDVMANEYLYNELPVVITDGTRDWPIDLADIDMNTLKKVYLQGNNMDADAGETCTFDAYDPDIRSAQQLFTRIDKNEMDHWQGYWENCEAGVAKNIRKFYRRPYFLPPMAESGSENWIFASYSSASNTKNVWYWDMVFFGGSATWITQVKGKSKIVLSPQSPCDKTCQKMSATLKPGETIVFGNNLWQFQHKPLHAGETIAFAATVRWDSIN